MEFDADDTENSLKCSDLDVISYFQRLGISMDLMFGLVDSVKLGLRQLRTSLLAQMQVPYQQMQGRWISTRARK